MNRYASRKFLLALLAFATFTVLLVLRRIDHAAYVTLSMFALGGYLGANAVQKIWPLMGYALKQRLHDA